MPTAGQGRTPGVSIQSSEPILTIEQVAERLQLKPSTIYELTRRRNRRPLPVLRAGKCVSSLWNPQNPQHEYCVSADRC